MAKELWMVSAGSSKTVKTKNIGFKATIGAVENKNFPESVFINLSSYVKPKMSVTSAQASSITDPDELGKKIAMDFEREVERAKRKMPSMFNSEYFDVNSVITIIDYLPKLTVVGKKQRFSFEVNIDTVNTLGPNGPTTNPRTGKTHILTFKDFESELKNTIDKILALEVFSVDKSLMVFSQKKTGK